VKFTNSGKVNVSVSAGRATENSILLRLAVEDTGIGIPPGQLELIFHSFEQVDSGLARSYPGLGLGLALVRKLVALMDGSVEVESEPGKGSTFTVQIPVRLPAEPVTLEKPTARRPLILAVEDNPVGMLVLRHSLERHAVEVDSAADGSAALEAAGKRRYELILMDLEMPGMDGFETTEAIRKLPGYEATPILALTANFSDEIRSECQRRGMQAFLSKPIEPTHLWEAVARYLKAAPL
jgi:CheY-like chemotaxis protein